MSPSWHAEAARLETEEPGLWPAFLAVVRQLQQAGYTRSSVRQVMDILRFRDGRKMPNRVGPILGRMLADRHPELAGFVQVKRSRLDDQATSAETRGEWWFT